MCFFCVSECPDHFWFWQKKKMVHFGSRIPPPLFFDKCTIFFKNLTWSLNGPGVSVHVVHPPPSVTKFVSYFYERENQLTPTDKFKCLALRIYFLIIFSCADWHMVCQPFVTEDERKPPVSSFAVFSLKVPSGHLVSATEVNPILISQGSAYISLNRDIYERWGSLEYTFRHSIRKALRPWNKNHA